MNEERAKVRCRGCELVQRGDRANCRRCATALPSADHRGGILSNGPLVVVRSRRSLALSSDPEFCLYFSDAGPEAALDFSNGLCLSDVAGFIEVPQVAPEFIEEFAWKTAAHRLDDFATELVQERQILLWFNRRSRRESGPEGSAG